MLVCPLSRRPHSWFSKTKEKGSAVSQQVSMMFIARWKLEDRKKLSKPDTFASPFKKRKWQTVAIFTHSSIWCSYIFVVIVQDKWDEHSDVRINSLFPNLHVYWRIWAQNNFFPLFAFLWVLIKYIHRTLKLQKKISGLNVIPLVKIISLDVVIVIPHVMTLNLDFKLFRFILRFHTRAILSLDNWHKILGCWKISTWSGHLFLLLLEGVCAVISEEEEDFQCSACERRTRKFL